MQQVKPKKHLGQHFLADQNTAIKIAEALTGYEDYQKVIEIGPGTGALTQHLFDTPYAVEVVEIDTESIDFLKEKYSELIIHNESFLKMNFDQFTDNVAIIGNFPYNISSQILFKILEEREKVPEMVGMFQKEVAERVAEKPGSKRFGILSVLIQTYYEVEYLFTVNESVFIPPPKVKSGVIRIQRKKDVPDCNYSNLKHLVKMAFNQRRKTLRNSLKPLINKKPEVKDFEIFNKRPEQLEIEQFLELTKLLF